jgi:hypothetical protein
VVLILPRTRDPVPRAIAATGTTDPEAWRKALEQAMAEARSSSTPFSCAPPAACAISRRWGRGT